MDGSKQRKHLSLRQRRRAEAGLGLVHEEGRPHLRARSGSPAWAAGADGSCAGAHRRSAAVIRGESWVTNAYEGLAFVTLGTIPQYTYPLPDKTDTVLEIEYS